MKQGKWQQRITLVNTDERTRGFGLTGVSEVEEFDTVKEALASFIKVAEDAIVYNNLETVLRLNNIDIQLRFIEDGSEEE